MSKDKEAKKAQKAEKKRIKAEKQYDAAYSSLVKKIEKKNAKSEKKANKKNKPFTPIPIPEKGEPLPTGNKGGKVVKAIILALLIVFFIYFIVMWVNFQWPELNIIPTSASDVVDDEKKSAGEVETYSNPHDITTTPTYSSAEAQKLLKQTIHDNWKEIGFKSDVSGEKMSKGSKTTVNSADCYTFTCSGKTFAVATNLSAVYVKDGKEYKPLSFSNTDYLF